MGAERIQPRNAEYFKVVDGRLVREYKEYDPSIEGIETVHIKNSSGVVTSTKHVVAYNNINGFIKDIKVKQVKLPDQDIEFDSIAVTLEDGIGPDAVFETKLLGDHGISLINRLWALVEAGMAGSKVNIGAYVAQNEGKRDGRGVWMRVGDQKIPTKYVKDTMPPETKWEEMKDKAGNPLKKDGKVIYDRSLYDSFFRNALVAIIIPAIEEAAKKRKDSQVPQAQATATETTGVTVVSDEDVF